MTREEQVGRTFVSAAVGPEKIDAASLVDFVTRPRCGAVNLFFGTVRDHSPGKSGVTHLEYEAYDDVAEEKIREIIVEAAGKWDPEAIAVAHRVGSLQVGETSVAVAVGAAHRDEAFSVGRFVIDELKKRVPIWKKEHWPGGAEWVREDLEHKT